MSVTNVRHVTERLKDLRGMHRTAHDLLRTFAAIANHAVVPDDTISMLMIYLLCWRDWIASKRFVSGQRSGGGD